MKIGPPVPEKIFEGFLPYWGVAAILVMPLASCHQVFISLYPKTFIQSLVQIDTVVSEKVQIEFLYVHDLGPRSRNDIDLQYSHICIYIGKNTLFRLYPIEKPKLPNLTLS